MELCEQNIKINGPQTQQWHAVYKMTHGEKAKLKHSQRCKSLRHRKGIFESKGVRESREMGDIKK